MKRFWLGLGILLFFFATGILLSAWMNSTNQHISQHLSQACTLSQEGDMAEAKRLAENADLLWSAYRNRIATLADHTPMEEIDSLFSELKVYVRMNEPVHFSATCARLALLVQSMAEAHSINWWAVL